MRTKRLDKLISAHRAANAQLNRHDSLKIATLHVNHWACILVSRRGGGDFIGSGNDTYFKLDVGWRRVRSYVRSISFSDIFIFFYVGPWLGCPCFLFLRYVIFSVVLIIASGGFAIGSFPEILEELSKDVFSLSCSIPNSFEIIVPHVSKSSICLSGPCFFHDRILRKLELLS